jgi:tetratricopeptide (TPR) repeat protein
MSCYADLPFAELTALIAAQPDEVELRLALVEQYARRKEFDEAVTQVCLAEELDPENPVVAAWKAMCLTSAGQVIEGSEAIKKVLWKYPCAEFHNWLITEVKPLFVRDSFDPMAADLEKQINDEGTGIPPEAVQCCVAFGRISSLFQTDPDRCITELENHIVNWPDDVNAVLFLAKACRYVKKFERATELYRIVIEKAPDATIAMFDLATIVSDPWEAIELMRRGLEICDFDNRAKCKLAERLNQVGKTEQAKNAVARIPGDSPFYVDALVAQARSLELEGKFVEACELLEKAATMAPQRGDIRGKYGQVLCDLARFEEAMKELEIATSLDPGQYIHWANIGFQHEFLGKHEKAIVAFQSSLQLEPACGQVATSLAKLLFAKGDADQAVELLERVLEINPNDFGVRAMLGEVRSEKLQTN